MDYQTSHDIVVQEGETVNLTCSAVGSPEPTIKWRKEKHRSLLSIENKESMYKYISITIEHLT